MPRKKEVFRELWAICDDDGSILICNRPTKQYIDEKKSDDGDFIEVYARAILYDSSHLMDMCSSEWERAGGIPLKPGEECRFTINIIPVEPYPDGE